MSKWEQCDEVCRRFNKTDVGKRILPYLDPKKAVQLAILNRKFYHQLVPEGVESVYLLYSDKQIDPLLTSEPKRAQPRAMKKWKELGPITCDKLRDLAPVWFPVYMQMPEYRVEEWEHYSVQYCGLVSK